MSISVERSPATSQPRTQVSRSVADRWQQLVADGARRVSVQCRAQVCYRSWLSPARLVRFGSLCWSPYYNPRPAQAPTRALPDRPGRWGSCGPAYRKEPLCTRVRPWPVATDFGIAAGTNTTALTQPGTILGTPSYLAPEQVLGEAASARSDVYALGLVAFECLAGQKPFVAEDPFATALQRVHSAPTNGNLLRPNAFRRHSGRGRIRDFGSGLVMSCDIPRPAGRTGASMSLRIL